MWLRTVAALAVAGACAAAALHGCGRRPERTLYVGGPILTMNATDAVVDALLVDGDRIAAAGAEADLRRQAGPQARIVDLNGRALLPGFIDAHSHFPGIGLFAVHVDLRPPPAGSTTTIDDIVERLRERAAATPPGGWVIGIGYDDTLLDEMRHPARADLDRASTDHPVMIVHISGHLAAANGRALSELGIRADTPDPEGGRIRRDPASGQPDGVLEETAANGALGRVFRPSLRDALRIVRAGSEVYVRAGVTTAQNGYATAMQFWTSVLLSRLGVIPLRLVLWPAGETADALLDGWLGLHAFDSDWVRVGAVKLVADGSIQGYTGYLREPYHIPPPGQPGFRGYPRMKRTALLERVAHFHARGLQVAVHGNGDAAIDDILDAFEAAQQSRPRPDARPVIIHAQMTRTDQLDRMHRLGVIPSFFPLHTFYWGDRHRDIFLGPERTARISPTRSAADRGLHFTIHTDAPVVPMEPLRLVWSAVNRRSTSGARIGDAERITPLQALRAVTADAAYQHFEEDRKGSLEPGKLADLVILSASPLAHPEAIDGIRVVETIIGGRTAYRAD